MQQEWQHNLIDRLLPACKVVSISETTVPIDLKTDNGTTSTELVLQFVTLVGLKTAIDGLKESSFASLFFKDAQNRIN